MTKNKGLLNKAHITTYEELETFSTFDEIRQYILKRLHEECPDMRINVTDNYHEYIFSVLLPTSRPRSGIYCLTQFVFYDDNRMSVVCKAVQKLFIQDFDLWQRAHIEGWTQFDFTYAPSVYTVNATEVLVQMVLNATKTMHAQITEEATEEDLYDNKVQHYNHLGCEYNPHTFTINLTKEKLFSGLYESLWVTNQQKDYEAEDLFVALKEKLNAPKAELKVNTKYNQMFEDIGRWFENVIQSEVFGDSDLYMVDVSVQNLYSPREYNFEMDQIVIRVHTDIYGDTLEKNWKAFLEEYPEDKDRYQLEQDWFTNHNGSNIYENNTSYIVQNGKKTKGLFTLATEHGLIEDEAPKRRRLKARC